jgi:septal ring factor EnvC (AmiA/AmiB activator)
VLPLFRVFVVGFCALSKNSSPMKACFQKIKIMFCKKNNGIQILCLVTGCLLLFPAGRFLWAQDHSPQIDEIKKQARDIDREIEESEAKIKKFSQREADIISTLNQVDLVLNKSRKQIAILERQIDALEKKIADTTQASEDLIQKIKANDQYIAKRLVALYKLSWLGKFQLMASAANLQELLQRQTAITRILAYDEKVMNQIMENRQNLENVSSQLQAHRDEKQRRIEQYQQEINQIAVERKKRSTLLAHVRKEISAQQAVVESLKQAALQLDEKIQDLGAGATAADSNAYMDDKPFLTYKGLLKMPVKGKIVSLFGRFKNTRDDVLNFRSGIEIQTERGEPIHAVYRGKILYAEWFKGYGNMIIIDHGDSYYSVYAHIEEVFKAAGDLVEAGEVMATAGDTGSMTGPKLYFEIRHHGKPLDPMQWLEGG